MKTELIGKYGFNQVIDLIKKTYKMNSKIYFYDRKESILRGWHKEYNFQKQWTLTGDNIKESEKNVGKVRFEIPLDLKQNIVNNLDLDFESSQLFEIINNFKMIDNKNTFIQTAVKKRNDFEIKVFKIVKGINGYHLIIMAINSIDEKQYKKNFGFPNNEYGHVSIGGVVDIPPFVFKDVFKKSKLIHTNTREIQKISEDSIEKVLKLFKANIYNTNYADIRFSAKALILAFNLKFLINITDANNKQLITKEESDVAYFNINLSTGITYLPFKSFNIDENIDFNVPEFDIYVLTIKSIFKTDNLSGALHKNSYNYYGQIVDNTLDTIGFYEILNFNKNKETAKPYLFLFNEVRIPTVEAKFIFNGSMPYEKKDIQNKLTIINEGLQDKIKNKWEKILEVYKRIKNPSNLEISFLALYFIKKYFIIIPNQNYRIDNHFTNNSLNPIKSFFDSVYGKYEDFFGVDYVSAFIERVSTFNINPTTVINNRIEKAHFNLNTLKRGDAHQIGQYFYPKSILFQVSAKSKSKGVSNIIIINDSGTKVAWKAKIRKFIKNKADTTINAFHNIILTPSDKIQMRLLLHVFNSSSYIIKYSDFQKDINIKKSSFKTSDIDKKITCYGINSNQKVYPIKKELQTFDENDIIIEYLPSKKLFIYKGKNYNLYDFCPETIKRLISRITPYSIYIVPGKTYKILKNKNIKTLENYIDNDLEKDFSDFHSIFNVFPYTDLSNVYIQHITKVFRDLFRYPLMQIKDKKKFSTIKNRQEEVKYHNEINDLIFMIYRELPIDFKKTFGLLLTKNITSLDTFIIRNNTGALGEIFKKIEVHPDEKHYLNAGKIITNNIEYFRRKPNRYSPLNYIDFGTIHTEYIELLIKNNMLNINKDESDKILKYFKQLNYNILNNNLKIFTLLKE